MFRKRKDETKKAKTSNVEAAATSPVTREEIALCAYYIWEKGGRPEDRALEHWLQAELQLRAARSLDAHRPRGDFLSMIQEGMPITLIVLVLIMGYKYQLIGLLSI